MLTAFALIIVVICMYITKKTLNGVYKQDLHKRYSSLFSIGAAEKQIEECIKKEIILILKLANIISLIVVSTVLIVVSIVTKGIAVRFSLIGYILANLITIFIIKDLSRTVIEKIFKDESLYETIKRKSGNKYDSKNYIPPYIKSPAGILGYKNYKADRKYFNTLVISSVMLIICLIVSYCAKEWYDMNYYYKVDENKPNIIISSENEENAEELNNLRYEKLKEIEKLNMVSKSYIIKRFNIEAVSGISTSNFVVMALADEEYNKYIKSIGFEETNVDGGLIWYKKDYNGNDVRIDIKEIGDIVKTKNGKFKEEVKFVTDKLPFGAEDSPNSRGLYIINQNNINEEVNEINYLSMAVYSNQYNELEKYVEELYMGFEINNIQGEFEKNSQIIKVAYIYINLTIMLIFAIGAIGGINAICTVMHNRKDENIALRSLGVNKHEFIKIFFVENIHIAVIIFFISLITSFIVTNFLFCFMNDVVGYPLIYNFRILVVSNIIIFLSMNIINFIIYIKQK